MLIWFVVIKAAVSPWHQLGVTFHTPAPLQMLQSLEQGNASFAVLACVSVLNCSVSVVDG